MKLLITELWTIIPISLVPRVLRRGREHISHQVAPEQRRQLHRAAAAFSFLSGGEVNTLHSKEITEFFFNNVSIQVQRI